MNLVEQMNDILEKAKQQVQDMLALCLKEFFKQNPGLESFGFTAYTPYFNDGDECVYSVHGYSPDVNEIDGCEIEYGENRKDEELVLLQEKVREFIESLPEEVVKNAWGDHAAITVYRDGTSEVSEYQHD